MKRCAGCIEIVVISFTLAWASLARGASTDCHIAQVGKIQFETPDDVANLFSANEVAFKTVDVPSDSLGSCVTAVGQKGPVLGTVRTVVTLSDRRSHRAEVKRLVYSYAGIRDRRVTGSLAFEKPDSNWRPEHPKCQIEYSGTPTEKLFGGVPFMNRDRTYRMRWAQTASDCAKEAIKASISIGREIAVQETMEDEFPPILVDTIRYRFQDNNGYRTEGLIGPRS